MLPRKEALTYRELLVLFHESGRGTGPLRLSSVLIMRDLPR